MSKYFQNQEIAEKCYLEYQGKQEKKTAKGLKVFCLCGVGLVWRTEGLGESLVTVWKVLLWFKNQGSHF